MNNYENFKSFANKLVEVLDSTVNIFSYNDETWDINVTCSYKSKNEYITEISFNNNDEKKKLLKCLFYSCLSAVVKSGDELDKPSLTTQILAQYADIDRSINLFLKYLYNIIQRRANEYTNKTQMSYKVGLYRLCALTRIGWKNIFQPGLILAVVVPKKDNIELRRIFTYKGYSFKLEEADKVQISQEKKDRLEDIIKSCGEDIHSHEYKRVYMGTCKVNENQYAIMYNMYLKTDLENETVITKIVRKLGGDDNRLPLLL